MRPPAAYRQYMLAMLVIVLIFNKVERLALGILLQDIKVDLHLSDTELGLLSGIAFALFYSVMGIPIARAADRGNRVTIMAVCTFLQCAAVTTFGLAQSFGQLLVARIGAAVGEAGCIPPAHSLIADFFTRGERPRAVARYMLGYPLSAVIGYLLAGWLNELYGWRTTFILLGAPGLLLSFIIWRTLREPRSQGAVLPAELGDAATVRVDLAHTFRTLARNRAYRNLLLGYAIATFFSTGIQQWQPAFFMRSHGMTSAELGMWFALIFGGSGIIGMVAGGELAARFAAGREGWQIRGVSIAYVALAIFSVAIYISPNRYVALGMIALTAFGIYATFGPMFSAIQSLVPDRMRAISIATIYFFANLLGMGFGPLAAGVISDILTPFAGDDALRYALLALCPGYLLAALLVWRASCTVEADIEAAASGSVNAGEYAQQCQKGFQ